MNISSTIKPQLALTILAFMLGSSNSTLAAMTTQEVERLGKDLTPVGAEKAGNKDGSIPDWEGGLAVRPIGLDAKVVYADPFANEKSLYTITAANLQQYQDKLAPGQLSMLKRFPSYKMNVYPSHRTAALPQREYDLIKMEGGKVALAVGGNGILNIKSSSVPFPIPKSGLEVIWNHLSRYRGGSFMRPSLLIPVQVNGTFTPVVRTETLALASSMEKPEPNRLFYYMAGDTAPSSIAGGAELLHEPLDQVKEPRLAWLYNPGTRRVMRAPEVSYDTPGNNVDGLATTDDYDGFNGAPDRYDWKLIGKKDMIISYNNYRLIGKDAKVSDIIKPGHMNQDMVRYELHRVWTVEATLKAGKRHVYAKRTFYVDEDSWQIAHADMFDGRGELWRVHELHAVQYYDFPTPWIACDVQYDLQARRYLITGLVNAAKPIKFGVKFDTNAFSTDAMRRFAN